MMLLDQFGRAIRRPKAELIPMRGRYDSAQTRDSNREHWAQADGYSANAANSRGVRTTLRNRSRYEINNNCYGRGIVDSRAAYLIGSGPTLQITQGGMRSEAGAEVSRLFSKWSKVRKIPQKLNTVSRALDTDGEVFGMFGNGRASMKTPVWLDVRLYEADQFDDTDPLADDDSGVRVDGAGEPTAYAMLPAHPGDATQFSQLVSKWIDADRVLHVFDAARPGQKRGIPRTTPALPLFAYLRRFTLATVEAAETAADFAAILSSDLPPDAEQAANVAAWERVELERGALLTTPAGQVLSQLKAEHPNATYDEFVRALLREISRCFPLPPVIALGDSTNYNYASGRLDLQGQSRADAVCRTLQLEGQFLDRIFEEWLDEALLIPGFLPVEFQQDPSGFDVAWRWPQPEHVDRQKEAQGQAIELENGTTTLKAEYARQSKDWEIELEQRALEKQRQKELGLIDEQKPEDAAADQEAESDSVGSQSSN